LAEIALPNMHALAVMVLIFVALVLFSRDEVPLETTSLVVLVLMTVGFTVFPFEAEGERLVASEFFLGFGNKALIAVCALMIVGQGLVRTGALEPVGRFLAKVWRWGPSVCLLITLIITATLSAFINNTPIVVMMLPILIGVAVRTGSSPTGTLIPMGFASILGGMATTIGTSTNLLVVNVAADMGMDPFSMFDFVGPVLVAGSLTIAYLWLVVPRLLPEREMPMSSGIARVFTAQIRLDEGSPVIGRRLSEAILKTGDDMSVESIQRGNGVFITPLPDVLLKPGDRITTSDTQDNLREFARVLAFNRYEDSQERKSPGLDEVQLQAGDVLLVQSTPENLRELKHAPDFLVLDGSFQLPSTRKAPLALAIMLAVVALAAFKVLPIEVAAVLGCGALILTRCLSWKDAMNALNAQVILIIVSSLAMGAALLQTGGADYLAKLFVYVTFGAPPAVVLAGLMLMMGILTNIVTNNAAAVIGTPIAIGIAQRLGLPLEPFVLAVVFGANLSFVTPMAYQTHMLLMNAAGYKFTDFVRVGLPLAIGLWLILTTVLVWTYGL
jgi:di/tricarboxylate transporter